MEAKQKAMRGVGEAPKNRDGRERTVKGGRIQNIFRS